MTVTLELDERELNRIINATHQQWLRLQEAIQRQPGYSEATWQALKEIAEMKRIERMLLDAIERQASGSPNVHINNSGHPGLLA